MAEEVQSTNSIPSEQQVPTPLTVPSTNSIPNQQTSTPITSAECEVSSNSKLPPLPPSSVWNHFKKIIPPDGSKVKKCNCNYCNKELACASEHGTSSLKRHLDKCWLFPYRGDKKQKLLNFPSDKGDDSSSIACQNMLAWKFDQEYCRKMLARMIIIDELPFKFVEREGFRVFCNAMNPRFNLLSRITVAKDCFGLYEEEKKKLKIFLEKSCQRVCLTTDMWTSNQNLGYMCVTAHFIDENWKLQKRIINFSVVPSPHTGDVICNVLESCLLSWGLDKVTTITVDNAANNDVAIRSLKRRLGKKNGLLLNGDFLHVRCCAHVLNLIVKESLKYFEDSLIKVRSVVKYVRSSPARGQQFQLCCEQEKIQCKKTLCLDCPTRWNSTFLMVETALEFQKAFECLEERDMNFRMECKDILSEQEWENTKVICKFLEAFYTATLRLSGSLSVTSNIYFKEVFAIESLLMKWSRSDDPTCHNMAMAMMEKFKKYWDNADRVNIFLIIAAVLDPRKKMKYVKLCYSYSNLYPPSEVDAKVANVRNVLECLVYHYQLHESSSSRTMVDVSSSFDADTLSSNSDIFDIEIERQLEENENLEVGTEIDQYLMENLVKKTNDFDILGWWKYNSSRLPILSKVARDILPIPVSTVASESAFSTSGRILDQFRSSLTPRVVESLLCAQDWLRLSNIPINNEEELMDEIEKDLSRIQVQILMI